MLSCEELCIYRGSSNNALIYKLGISIAPGTVLCAYGDNGCGKTSFLKVLSTLKKQDQGIITYNGHDIEIALDEYRNLIAYIGHIPCLDYMCTVRENLQFWGGIHNMNEGLEAALLPFGVVQYADVPIFKLSHGWQKRVAFSRLLLTQATLWFLDEPFADLDCHGVSALIELIKIRILQQGIVVFTAQENQVQHIGGSSMQNIFGLNLNLLQLSDFRKI